jgi:predicted glycosyltransferase
MYDDAERAQSPRIIMYSQDGFGLGHMRRTNSIAGWFLRICPQACILTLSDSRLGEFFASSRNHDYLKLPSIVKTGPGNWRAVNLALPFDEIYLLRQEVIRSAVLNFRPHILLVDHMPHGAMGELLPTLEALRASGADTKIVLGLRDILDAPPVVQDRWRVERAIEAIERYYDMVLVYGQRDVFDLAKQYRFPRAVRSRMRYCGYVCTPNISQTAAGIRAVHLAQAPEDTRLIVSMAGGGDDAYPMMRALLDALPAILAQQACKLVLIVGPFMPPESQRDLRERARDLPVSILRSVDDIPGYIEAADLVVAMAGYNTTVEILRLGHRAILIPRPGPSAEQRMRARLFAERGWVSMIDPDEVSVETVAGAVVHSLRQEPHSGGTAPPDLDGLAKAVDLLRGLLPAPPLDSLLPLPLVAAEHKDQALGSPVPL